MSGFSFDFGDGASASNIVSTPDAKPNTDVKHTVIDAAFVEQHAAARPVDGASPIALALGTRTILYHKAPKMPALESAEGLDIVPGVYYGGLKVWSCTRDLCELLLMALDDHLAARLVGGSVLELGCGHALPSIAALIAGAKSVFLHDYNEEVIETCALRNVALNAAAGAFSSASAPPELKWCSGDWTTFQPDGAAFDVIVGADVLFDDLAAAKLVGCLARLLRAPNAPVALIASKEFYFGTGGGVVALEAECAKAGLRAETIVKVANCGNEMPRCIVCVTLL